MKVVPPATGAAEVVVAANQPEYTPLTAAVYQHPNFGDAMVLLTRWELDEEDRARIAAGEDLYNALMTFGQPMQPIMVQVGPDGWAVPADPTPTT